MKKFILYPLAVLALLFTACEKPDIKADFNISWSDIVSSFGNVSFPDTIISNRFDRAAFSYINIPDRSYFIYKDSASGTADSLVLNRGYDFVYVPPVTGNPSKPGYYYSVYDLELANYWSYNPNLIFFKGHASCDSDYKNTKTFIDSNFTLDNELTGLAAFWYPFVSSGNQQYSFISSLSVGSKSYNDVHCFFSSNGLPASNDGYLATTFWWVKGIGIVKKEIRTHNSIKTSLLVRHG
jgi:hypothetical protein